MFREWGFARAGKRILGDLPVPALRMALLGRMGGATGVRTIIGLRDKAPFRPFQVHLADGRALREDHPDLLSPSPAGRELVIWNPDGSLNLVDADQVTSVALPKRNRTRRG